MTKYIDHTKDQLGRHRVGIISELMPEFIKVAEEEIASDDLTKLADGCFAYSNGMDRSYPIHTPEHTWLSHAYFEKFAHTIPEQDRSVIKKRIDDAYLAFGLPEDSVIKVASVEDEIDVLHSLATELNKFIANYKTLPPAERRIKAKQLEQHAKALNREGMITDKIKRYTGDHLRPDYAQAFGDRMRYFRVGAPERLKLLKMQDEVKAHVPENIARALYIFDRSAGIDRDYDIHIEDPFAGILGHHNCMHDNMLSLDGHIVDKNKFTSFDWDSLKDIIEESVLSKFKEDPIEGFQGAPQHIRLIIIKKVC